MSYCDTAVPVEQQWTPVACAKCGVRYRAVGIECNECAYWQSKWAAACRRNDPETRQP